MSVKNKKGQNKSGQTKKARKKSKIISKSDKKERKDLIFDENLKQPIIWTKEPMIGEKSRRNEKRYT